MAWELQRHMLLRVVPSILEAMKSKPDPRRWLTDRYADVYIPEDPLPAHWNLTHRDLSDWTDEAIAEAIAEKVEEHGLVTNGGREVYLGDIECETIPWCTDEQELDYYSWAERA